MEARRPVEVLIISDVHLGTYGCHAKELLAMLKTVKPKLLILNGDIIDGWAFSKRYFPNAHMAVLAELFKMMRHGSRIVYITGNHDEFLRKYTDMEMGNLFLTNKYLFETDGKINWVFHGDVFDHTTKGGAKFLAKIGGVGYDWLILLNRAINWFLAKLGRPKVSLSKRIKDSVKKAVAFIADFEEKAVELAIDNRYDTVICGHIHQPANRQETRSNGKTLYLNSGDWIENLTWLEYGNREWTLYHYHEKNFQIPEIAEFSHSLNPEDLFNPNALVAFSALT